MSAELSVIRRSDLVNRRVLERNTVEELGRVEQLWLNPQSHQVVGLTCKSGVFGGKKRSFTWEQIAAVGESVLVNSSPDGIEPQKPEEVILLIGHEVLTDAGNKAGVLVDYLLDVQTGAITYYLFQSSGWRGILDGLYLLPIEAISSIGAKAKALIVNEAVVLEPQLYVEGLHRKMGQAAEKVSQVAEYLREDADETFKHLDAVKRSAQKLAGGLQNQAQVLKEKAQQVAEQAKEKLESTKTPMEEKGTSAATEATTQDTSDKDPSDEFLP